MPFIPFVEHIRTSRRVFLAIINVICKLFFRANARLFADLY